MSYLTQQKQKLFNSSEELVSMVLGLVIVVVIVGLIFNFIQRRKGNISVPGISTVNENKNIAVNDNEKLKVLGEATVTVGTSEYVVVKGDNLWRIAESKLGSGYDWVKISKLNNLKNPESLSVGQKLKLPEIKVKEVVTTNKVVLANNEYTTLKGDSLWKISVKIYGDGYRWVNLWKANRKLVSNPDRLFSGVRLQVPTISK